MTTHPLAQEDQELIQDLMLTKVVFLLASGAEMPEWQFELRAMESLSEHRWNDGNAFLFDYTLGRVLAAILKASGTPQLGDVDGQPQRQAEFLQRFVHLISHDDQRNTEDLWQEHEDPTAAGDSHSLVTTLALIRSLQQHHEPSRFAAALEHIPGAFRPHGSV